MARRHGHVPRGQRALDAVPHGRRCTTIFTGALRAEGIVAPLVLEGAVNGRAFLAVPPPASRRPMLAPARTGCSGLQADAAVSSRARTFGPAMVPEPTAGRSSSRTLNHATYSAGSASSVSKVAPASPPMIA